MNKRSLFLLLILGVAAAFIAFLGTLFDPGKPAALTQWLQPAIPRKPPAPAPPPPEKPKEPAFPDYSGERILYTVKYGALRIGTAEFINNPDSARDGERLLHFTFTTRVTNFTDVEQIYSSPATLLPVRVERAITHGFSREQISESYDQQNRSVTIQKTKGTKTLKPLVIRKERPLNNAILLPYFLRRLRDLRIGSEITVNLPTRELLLRIDTVEEITVPAGTFPVYHFKSTPRQIEIWLTSDERRIPVRIIGSGIFGYELLMSAYTPPASANDPVSPTSP